MNRLDRNRQIHVLRALIEGNSIRATCRMTGVSKPTVLKLLADVGKACAEYQDATLRNLSCKRLQVDEIWAYCYAKQKNVPEEKQGVFGYGDVWTYTAICADSKLVPCWLVARRTAENAQMFMHDLAARLKHRVQLTTDGHSMYLEAVEAAFGADVDYSMLMKIYGVEPNVTTGRYSPATCLGAERIAVCGRPERQHISTSFVERQNLTMRMQMRRFTRLTNAFSKKVENLSHAVALHFMHYNFCRIHQTLRVTPAMEAGITTRVWEISDILGLLT